VLLLQFNISCSLAEWFNLSEINNLIPVDIDCIIGISQKKLIIARGYNIRRQNILGNRGVLEVLNQFDGFIFSVAPITIEMSMIICAFSINSFN